MSDSSVTPSLDTVPNESELREAEETWQRDERVKLEGEIPNSHRSVAHTGYTAGYLAAKKADAERMARLWAVTGTALHISAWLDRNTVDGYSWQPTTEEFRELVSLYRNQAAALAALLPGDLDD